MSWTFIIIYLLIGLLVSSLIMTYRYKIQLNLSELRYSEIKKSNANENLHKLDINKLAEENLEMKKLITLLISYVRNKPVLILKDSPEAIPKIKRSFEIKKTGVGSCRVKSSKEGGKRITRIGTLALECTIDKSFLTIQDIELASEHKDIRSFGEVLLKSRLYNVIDTSEDN